MINCLGSCIALVVEDIAGILIFSQMTHMLDIFEDFNYEIYSITGTQQLSIASL